jgi:phage tail sheath protein FI
MRKNYSTPGVYIQEHTFRPPTIEPASTAIAAIIGSFPEGVMKAAKQVRMWTAFENIYGGLSTGSLSSHCIKQFFDNEGKALWVVRIGTGQIKGASPFLQGPSILDRMGGLQYVVHSSNRAAFGCTSRKGLARGHCPG